MEDVKLDLVEAVHDRTQRLCLEFLVARRRIQLQGRHVRSRSPRPGLKFYLVNFLFVICCAGDAAQGQGHVSSHTVPE